jgi:hypothetical protein
MCIFRSWLCFLALLADLGIFYPQIWDILSRQTWGCFYDDSGWQNCPSGGQQQQVSFPRYHIAGVRTVEGREGQREPRERLGARSRVMPLQSGQRESERESLVSVFHSLSLSRGWLGVSGTRLRRVYLCGRLVLDRVAPCRGYLCAADS